MAYVCSSSSSSSPDHSLLPSLLRLSREIAGSRPPNSILQKSNIVSLIRKSHLLSIFFEDLLQVNISTLSVPAVLCLREILTVLRRFESLLHTCSSTSSRMRLALLSNSISDKFGHLTHNLSTFLDILPIDEIEDASDDVKDLVYLVKEQCRRPMTAGISSVSSEEEELRKEILAMVDEIEREIVPRRLRLELLFEKLGLNEPQSCMEEITKLETEIRDDNGATTLIALLGVVRYAKCVLFGASTPTAYSVEIGNLNRSYSFSGLVVPVDFTCPISLDLMKDPVVVSSGQTYDRDSIEHWIKAGRKTCPKSGQVLSTTHVIPNLALKNLIAQWCRDMKLPFDIKESSPPMQSDCGISSNKAALEAARMTALFLVQNLSASNTTEGSNNIVYELRQLSKTGSECRAFIGEAGAIPLLLPLMHSSDPNLQVNAVTVVLNLSILEDNKKRILETQGSLESVAAVLKSGRTWSARENAAATLLSLSSLHPIYRKRIGREATVAEGLVELVRSGPDSAKRDGLIAILNLAGVRENIGRLIEGGVIAVTVEAVKTVDLMDIAVAVLASMAKRGGAEAMGDMDGFVEKMVWVLRHGTDISREAAAAALSYVCKFGGNRPVEELAKTPGIEWVIWGMMGSGSERARHKAAALGRILRRWTMPNEIDRTATSIRAVGFMTTAQS